MEFLKFRLESLNIGNQICCGQQTSFQRLFRIIFDFRNEDKYLNVAPTPYQFEQRQDAKWAHFDLIGQILCFPL